MSEYREQVIEKMAHWLFNLIDYDAPYDRWNKINQKPYIIVAKNFLETTPELAVVHRIKPEHMDEYPLDYQPLIKDGWVKEVKE